MKDVIFGAMVVCLFSGIVTILAPSSKEGLKKELKLACALSVCACLLYPLIGLMGAEISYDVSSSPPPSDTDFENTKKAIIELTLENICSEMERQVAELYSLSSPSLTLNVDSTDTSNVKLNFGTLAGSGDLEGASAYISKALGCKIYWEEE